MKEEIKKKNNMEITENNEIEPVESVNVHSEMVRIMLMQYLDAILEQGIECDIDTDENGSFFLFAPVKGIEGRTAFFYLNFNEFENTYDFNAIYSSELLDVPEVASLTMEDSDSASKAADFVADFIMHCFSKEHMQYCSFEHITAQSLERYIQYLPDFFFDDKSKDYYAAGICLTEPTTVIPAGAAVYSNVDGNLVIDYVMIDEDLRGLGLAAYLISHILSTAIGNN